MATSRNLGVAPRGVSLIVGGLLLIALAVAMIVGSGGVATIAFSLVPLLAGTWIVARGSWARQIGFVVAAAYGAVVAFIATTPLRGLTPPPGQSRDPMDFATVAVAAGFALDALLIAIGKRVPRDD